jgi:hypothetical protein
LWCEEIKLRTVVSSEAFLHSSEPDYVTVIYITPLRPRLLRLGLRETRKKTQATWKEIKVRKKRMKSKKEAKKFKESEKL